MHCLLSQADKYTDSMQATAYANFINDLLQRVSAPVDPPTERLAAYEMLAKLAGVEDFGDLPDPDAGNWAEVCAFCFRS